MKTYLLNAVQRLKNYSQKLDAQAVLYDKSWDVFNETGDKELMIFRKNGELLISRNGIVQKGKWELFDISNLIIDVGEKSYLLNAAYIEDEFLALKLDGTNEFMVMIEADMKNRFSLNSIQSIETYLDNRYKQIKAKENEEKQRQKILEAKRQAEKERKEALRIQAEKEREEALRIEAEEREEALRIEAEKEKRRAEEEYLARIEYLKKSNPVLRFVLSILLNILSIAFFIFFVYTIYSLDKHNELDEYNELIIFGREIWIPYNLSEFLLALYWILWLIPFMVTLHLLEFFFDCLSDFRDFIYFKRRGII